MDKQQIREALRQVVKEEALRQWKGGDLACDYLAQSPGQPRKDVLEELAGYAGTDYSNLDSWQRVAEAWPPETRDLDYPWTLYRDYYRREDRFVAVAAYIAYAKKHGITSNHYRESQKFDGRMPTTEFTAGRALEQAERAIEVMPMADAVKLIGQMAKDKPGLLIAAYKQSHDVKQVVSRAQFEDAREHNQLIGQRNQGGIYRRLDEQEAVDDLIQACSDFAHAVDEIMPRLGDLPEERARGLNLGANTFLRSSLDAADGAVQKVKSFVIHGRTDLDSFIGSVLKGGS